jgi:hypothetical protein
MSWKQVPQAHCFLGKLPLSLPISMDYRLALTIESVIPGPIKIRMEHKVNTGGQVWNGNLLSA